MSLFTLYARLSYFFKDFFLFICILLITFLLTIVATVKIHKSSSPSRKKGFLLMLTFTVFLFVLIFSGFEAYFRYSFDESDSLGFLKVNHRWFQRHVVFNNYGYRDKDFTPDKKIVTTRIGVMGDSLTMGYGIKNVNDRFSNILENKLKAAGKDVEVYNLGQSGSDTWNQIAHFKKLKHLKFDIIVWQYFFNDAQATASSGVPILRDERKQGAVVETLSNHSYFFDYIYWRLAARYEKTFTELGQADIGAYKNAKNFQRHKNEIGDFTKILRENSKEVVVIMFPFIKFLPDNPIPDVYPRVKKIFSDNALPTIDLMDDLQGKKAKDLIVSQFDYHPNEVVQAVAAEKLYNALLPLIPEK